MAVQFVFANFLATEILTSIGVADTFINIPPTIAAGLPAISPGLNNQMALALWDGQNQPEIVYCTNNPQNGTLTITRGQEGTSAFAWSAGTQCSSVISAAVLNQALAGYVGNQNLYLPLAGGTMTGVLNIAADPLTNAQAANKHYVDTIFVGLGLTYLPLAGGTMAGNISMAGNRVLSLPTPLTGSEPATKAYSDLNLTELQDRSGALVTAGTSAAFTVATGFGYGAGIPDGTRLSFRLHANMAPSATLAVDGTTAVQLSATAGLAVQATRHVKGEVLSVVYRASVPEWIIENPDVLYTEQFTTTHIGNAYSVTTGYGLNGFASIPDGTIITVIFDNPNNGPATLNVDGIGSSPLRPFTGVDFSSGQLQTAQIVPSRFLAATGEWIAIGISPPVVVYGFDTANNLSLANSVSGNVLTIAVKAANTGLDPTPANPVTIQFRDPSLAGGPNQVQITSALSISTVVGAHLGASIANQAFRFWIEIFNNGGTPVLALSCQSFVSTTSGLVISLDESSLANTTGMSAGATTIGVFYTPAGINLSNKSYRIVGYLDYGFGLVTPGTYNNGPSKVQLFGPGISKPGESIQSTSMNTPTTTAFNTSSFVSTAIGKGIVPRAAMNPIRVSASGWGGATASPAALGTYQLQRGAVALGQVVTVGTGAQSNFAYALGPTLDLPNTIGTVTYAVYGKGNGVNTWTDQGGGIMVEELMG